MKKKKWLRTSVIEDHRLGHDLPLSRVSQTEDSVYATERGGGRETRALDV